MEPLIPFPSHAWTPLVYYQIIIYLSSWSLYPSTPFVYGPSWFAYRTIVMKAKLFGASFIVVSSSLMLLVVWGYHKYPRYLMVTGISLWIFFVRSVFNNYSQRSAVLSGWLRERKFTQRGTEGCRRYARVTLSYINTLQEAMHFGLTWMTT